MPFRGLSQDKGMELQKSFSTLNDQKRWLRRWQKGARQAVIREAGFQAMGTPSGAEASRPALLQEARWRRAPVSFLLVCSHCRDKSKSLRSWKRLAIIGQLPNATVGESSERLLLSVNGTQPGLEHPAGKGSQMWVRVGKGHIPLHASPSHQMAAEEGPI